MPVIVRTTARKTVPTSRSSVRGRRGRPSATAKIALPETLTEKAYSKLEEMIVTLELAPGSTVSEQGLSQLSGFGRTPIREAIQRLARELLVVVLPQRGLLISGIDVAKQLRLLRTRREVERLICRSAAKNASAAERTAFAELAAEFTETARTNDDISFLRLDREFNELCLTAARNEFAEGAMRLMSGLSRRFWYIHYKQTADLPETARLHSAVAKAIAEGDVDGAGRASDELLDNIESFTRSTVLNI
jgi:DNA-binding GntR family transcriptional regulator